MNEDRSRSERPVRTLAETDDTRDHWYDRVLTRLGLKPRESIRHDLEDVLAETVEDTDFSPQERAMLKNVLSFHRIRVEDVMVPRADIVAVAADTNLGELLNLFRTAGHSRLPVYGETLDDPKGMVHIRDFLDFIAMRADGGASVGSGGEAPLPSLGQIDLSMALSSANILRPVLFVPRSMPAIDLLVRMQATRTHMALVIDEYGGTDGLVSIEDLVEMVVGDIEDEHDEDSTLTIVPAADGTYIADARASLDEVKEVLGLDLTEEEGAEDIDTIGGFIVTLAGRVPSRSEVIEGPSGLEFEVLDADPRRVKRLRVHRRAPASTEVEISEGNPVAPRPESAAAE
ncbi:hemolysin family protein [Microvirga sp. CF3016]|uniref:hemolysin family protein n=1 Tax=Microvirga sp. CF3016 TaxID=3110181 RepID=UPI002E7A3AE6|nr:hemolysin family protein [Microvirga sp. CF3016]MEE1613039.1 hemolysin family protein [Microvirga sp. CF3016]